MGTKKTEENFRWKMEYNLGFRRAVINVSIGLIALGAAIAVCAYQYIPKLAIP